MFEPSIYRERRKRLSERLGSGLLLFPGNDESPMNYADNPYRFRQDSTFLYYWGLDVPGLFAAIDVERGEEVIFGTERTLDDVVWMGPLPTLAERAERVGVARVLPPDRLEGWLKASGAEPHFLPPYRAENTLRLARLLGRSVDDVRGGASEALIRAVVAQRSVKAPEEVAEIETALAASREMHVLAMQRTRPGVYEREVAGAMEGVALAQSGPVAYPVIFSVHGEILHNHGHGNQMRAGDLVVNDSGASSPRHYASDITRTIPVSGRFSERQRALYELVLAAEVSAIEAVRPGVPYRDIHLQSARQLAEGLRALGLMRGDVDEAVAAGAHALFFPHGLGHMLGLDVHDMEDLGENHVGYGDGITRSSQFGLRSLRLARMLEPGFVLTVEPGLYFIPALIDRWEAEGRHADFIDYARVADYRDAGGIRVEDNVLVEPAGRRVLGPPIPKTVEDVEAAMASG